jgi:hypothetical protein
MILFFADGRLGNQIFQYAFLNTIAKINEKIISFDMGQFVEIFEIENKNFKQIKLSKYISLLLKKLIKPYILYALVKIKLISYIEQDKNQISSLPIYKKRKGILPVTLVESCFFQSEDFFDSSKLDFSIKYM